VHIPTHTCVHTQIAEVLYSTGIISYQRTETHTYVCTYTHTQIAEELYSKGIISYPRTETEIFREGIDLQDIIRKLSMASYVCMCVCVCMYVRIFGKEISLKDIMRKLSIFVSLRTHYTHTPHTHYKHAQMTYFQYVYT
jgi:hypothetical protein